MNRRVADAILRLGNILTSLIDCSNGARPGWWSEQLEASRHGQLCAVYEHVSGEREGAVLLSDAAIGLVAQDGHVQWIPHATITNWTPPRKESPSTTLRLTTTSGERELRLRDGDPFRFVSFLLWLSRAERNA